MGADFGTFFLLVESITEIRRKPMFLKKFLLGEDYPCKWTTDFLATGNHSFSIFQRFLLLIVCFFFRLAEKCFSTETFIPASGKGFSG